MQTETWRFLGYRKCHSGIRWAIVESSECLSCIRQYLCWIWPAIPSSWWVTLSGRDCLPLPGWSFLSTTDIIILLQESFSVFLPYTNLHVFKPEMLLLVTFSTMPSIRRLWDVTWPLAAFSGLMHPWQSTGYTRTGTWFTAISCYWPRCNLVPLKQPTMAVSVHRNVLYLHCHQHTQRENGQKSLKKTEDYRNAPDEAQLGRNRGRAFE